MKSASTELLDLLHNSTEFLMADVFVIILATGEVLRYTAAETAVSFRGAHYRADGPIIRRDAVRTTRGLETEANKLHIAAENQHRLAGLPWAEAALGGALDGARVRIGRLFYRDWDTPVGMVTLFAGRVSDVSGSRSSVTVSVKSDIELLNAPCPRNLYQSGCMRTLYDAGCGVRRTSFTVTGRVTAQSQSGSELASNLRQVDGWFNQGVVTFTSGRNAGLSRTVKTHVGGRLSFALRLPHLPQAGDGFTIYPGCDKRQTTCASKFHNIGHFRGFPYIPAADTVV